MQPFQILMFINQPRIGCLPEPDQLALEIIENIEAVLEIFKEVLNRLSGELWSYF